MSATQTMTRPPPNYVGVARAVEIRGAVNVMGVVVDIWGSPYRTQGTSWCITFTIKDSNLDNGHTIDGLKVKYFTESDHQLPPVRLRDVILLRMILIKVINGKVHAVASQHSPTPWAVFRPDQDPTSLLPPITGPRAFEPTKQERDFAAALLEVAPASFHAATVVQPGSAQIWAAKTSTPRQSTAQQKFSLLKDIGDRKYVDLIGEIVKIHGNDSEKATVYITDYTENKDLFCYASDKDDDNYRGREGDEHGYIKPQKKGWKGPSGPMTIQITLWEPHASTLRARFNVNDLVRLKNVRVKGSRVEEGSMEGVIHQNRDKPDVGNACDVDFDDDRVKELISRKEQYWEAHPMKQKRKLDDDAERPSKKSKTKKKQEKAQPKKEIGQTTMNNKKRINVNENVKSRVPLGIPPQTLENIINNPSHNNPSPNGITYRLPFQNLCYHSTVRVVDFYPPLLEDFAVYQERPSVAYDKSRDPAASRTYFNWEWRFCLLVECIAPATPGQSKERIKLFVPHSEAEHLLNMTADDLSKNPDKLSDLREKLFILWGDLEERKRKALDDGQDTAEVKSVSSRPFNCSIMEYGVRCSHSRRLKDAPHKDISSRCPKKDCFGWERRFGLWKTTIHG